jgi:hypothetical protein
MKRFVLTMTALLSTAGASFAQSVTENITLQHVMPTQMMQTLNGSSEKSKQTFVPKGVETLKADDLTFTLKATGSSEAIGELKKLVKLLDVQPRQVMVKLRVVRVVVTADGPGQEEVVQQPTLITIQNKDAQVQVTNQTGNSFSAKVIPHLNGDDTVTLNFSSELVQSSGNTVKTQSVQKTVRLGQNEMKRFTGMTDSQDSRVIEAVRQGKLADVPGLAYTAYYFDVTVSETTPKTTEAKPGKPAQP